MKKILRIRIKELCIVFCLSSTISANDIPLSFDSLFPVTWYQKALTFSLLVWQQLADFMIDTNACKRVPFDEITGKLAYAQFFLNKMKINAIALGNEDGDYMRMILKKIKELIGMVVVTQKNEDFIECIQEMITNIQNSMIQIG